MASRNATSDETVSSLVELRLGRIAVFKFRKFKDSNSTDEETTSGEFYLYR